MGQVRGIWKQKTVTIQKRRFHFDSLDRTNYRYFGINMVTIALCDQITTLFSPVVSSFRFTTKCFIFRACFVVNGWTIGRVHYGMLIFNIFLEGMKFAAWYIYLQFILSQVKDTDIQTYTFYLVTQVYGQAARGWCANLRYVGCYLQLKISTKKYVVTGKKRKKSMYVWERWYTYR